jgi:hypothetical protein
VLRAWRSWSSTKRASKDYQRARLTRAKTDRVDALGLLDFLLRMPFVEWTPPAPDVLWPSSNSPGGLTS